MIESKLFVVGIGASAGGFDSFRTFFLKMPADSGMAFVLIQHLNPDHDNLTPQLLAPYTSMAVCAAQDKMLVKPNHVYILPSNSLISIKNDILFLKALPNRQETGKAVNIFFNSLAQDKKEKAIAIILSGCGQDGMEGCKTIKDKEGLVIAQDPNTIVNFKSMPQSIISSGLADYVLPVEKIPEFIIQYVSLPFMKKKVDDPLMIIANEDQKNNFNKIILYLKEKINIDFSPYKKPTLIRRIYRRIKANNLKDISTYLQFLENNKSEVELLSKDFTIKMTRFFRNPDSFEALVKNIFSKESDDLNTPFRVWVPGCCTGEEAYSIAILIMEQPLLQNRKIQIFATDIDAESLIFARKGIYPEKIKSQISPKHLEKFFDKINGMYVVKHHVRKNILFILHNLLTDIPFSKLNLISCRNLFIYIEPEVQKEIIKVFHFALKKDSYLFLGNAETIGRDNHLFQIVSKVNCLFKRIEPSLKGPLNFSKNNKVECSFSLMNPYSTSPSNRVFERINKHLADEYIPAFVIINSDYEVLYFFGRLSRYLQIPSGASNLNLMLMVNGNLSARLRKAIKKVRINQMDFIIGSAYIYRNQKKHPLEFKVVPLKKLLPQELFTISFNELKNIERDSDLPQKNNDIKEKKYKNNLSLEKFVEDLESRNLSLVISNEEAHSINEELQAASEEMETTKEELESLNEELTVVNAQLQEKIDFQERINDDLVNLFTSTKVATIFLDLDLCIKRFTPETQKLFNFRDSDIGRPINDITKNFIDKHFENDIKEVLKKNVPIEKEIITNTHEWYLRKIGSYKKINNEITGLVITFFNVTGLKNTQSLLQKSEKKLQKTIERIEFSNDELNNFAYICSHDLQEPVRTISSFAKLLSDHIGGMLDEESKSHLKFIFDSSKRMQDMIKDALIYAQLNHHQNEIKTINMNELIKETLENLNFSIDESSANVTCDKLPYILGDPISISTVFQNIIHNSLKFQNKVKNINIHIGVKSDNSGYIFSVKDNGIGIDMNHTKRLFQLFCRLNKKEEYPGTGIGLAICKKIINRLGGKIWLESEPGKGSTFYFSIPQKKLQNKKIKKYG
ncbi:MAG: chemotaxis protein CheB [Lutibacter sp.]